jgi:hypothetical protein
MPIGINALVALRKQEVDELILNSGAVTVETTTTSNKDFKICTKTFVTTSSLFVCDYSNFGLTTIFVPPIVVVEESAPLASNMITIQLTTYNNNDCSILTKDGLGFISGITVHLTVIGI